MSAFLVATNSLRFVGRLVNVDEFGTGRIVRILQQQWVNFSDGKSEWRDVPLEEEDP